MKTSYLFLLLLLLSFNSTVHASGKCQQFFQSLSNLSESHRQVRQAIEASDFKALQELIENKKIDPHHQKTLFNKSTLLHLAAQYSKDPGFIKTLATGIDISTPDSNGNTALHVAIDSNNIIATQVLIKADAPLAIQNKRGDTALHLAIRNLNILAVRELITKIDKQNTVTKLFFIPNKNKETIYSYVYSYHLRHHYYNTEKLSKEQKNALNEIDSLVRGLKPEVKKMEKAIETSDLKTMKKLIENREVDLHQTNIFNGYTFLHLAARHSKNPKVIETFIKAGIEIDAQDLNGNTALHIAVDSNNIIATKALIQAGASLDIQNKEGATALHNAVESLNVSAVREIIIQIGKQKKITKLFFIPNKNKETIYSYIYSYRLPLYLNIEKLSKKQAGALSEITSLIRGMEPEVKKMENAIEDSDLKTLKKLIEDKEINIHRKSLLNRHTFLHLAARHSKNPKVIKILITAGVEIDAQDLNGNTALQIAIDSNNIIAAQTLITAGASPFIQNKEGETALHLAINKGSISLVKALIEANAPLHTKNNQGKTPFDSLKELPNMTNIYKKVLKLNSGILK